MKQLVKVKDPEDSFECKCEGKLKEYVGNKVDITRKSDGLATVKFMQPIFIQKLEDEYELPRLENAEDTCNSWSNTS